MRWGWQGVGQGLCLIWWERGIKMTLMNGKLVAFSPNFWAACKSFGLFYATKEEEAFSKISKSEFSTRILSLIRFKGICCCLHTWVCGVTFIPMTHLLNKTLILLSPLLRFCRGPSGDVKLLRIYVIKWYQGTPLLYVYAPWNAYTGPPNNKCIRLISGLLKSTEEKEFIHSFLFGNTS